MSNSRATALGWILVHSEARYAGESPDNPVDELKDCWADKRWNRLWQWKRPHPLRQDDTPRSVLLAWRNEVFGEAVAAVTHDIGKRSSSFNFAFRLSNYQLLPRPIPLTSLQLGSRAHNHRDLIRLGPENWAAYLSAKGEGSQTEIETLVNPHKSQGFGLNAAERKAVELRAMEIATDYLEKQGYEIEDVSHTRPFDFLATKAGKSISIEVKGTTGSGDAIVLTKNEVEHQKMAYPDNLLILVDFIELTKGDQPLAKGGTLRAYSPWKILDKKLTPTIFSYIL